MASTAILGGDDTPLLTQRREATCPIGVLNGFAAGADSYLRAVRMENIKLAAIEVVEGVAVAGEAGVAGGSRDEDPVRGGREAQERDADKKSNKSRFIHCGKNCGGTGSLVVWTFLR